MSKPFYDEGKYRCRVTSQALGKASTGTPQFVLRFQVLGPMIDDHDYEPVSGYERTMYLYLTEKTQEYVIEDLKALGYNRGSFRYLDPNQPDFFDFKDMELTMYCSHDNDRNGDPKERWGVARGARKLEVAPLEPKALRDLDNLFGKQLKSLETKPDPQKVAPAKPRSEEITDDDVPF